ncbi:hypothetical protein [Streptomyces sp. NBC_01304]|uniref:hypothetical protein n=1 Tax=Streptomyces sp. NBC_01304 TaxID=2903818 RepID=UPI002E122197|nr:hypothetical protein OG430_48765 [Streptomyces sp. NBC_01304]
MRITVWHNTTPDSFTTWFRPEHPMLRVYSYASRSDWTEGELWHARAVFDVNRDWKTLEGHDRSIAAAYRLRRLRSFRIGDGFSVLQPGSGFEEFWTYNGHQMTRHEGPFPALALAGGEGSTPFGQPVTYLLPRRDDLVRDGLFETVGQGSAALHNAVAVHHGIPADEVAITSPV